MTSQAVEVSHGIGSDAMTLRSLRLFAVVVVGWLPVLLGSDAVTSAAALFPLADSSHPYFVPQHAGLLYAWAPLVVASACLLLLSPGLFLAIGFDAATGVGRWLLSALGLSLVAVSATAGIVQGLMGGPLCGGPFAAVVAACSLVSFAWMLERIAAGRVTAWPLDGAGAITKLLASVVAPLLLLIALSPKFYWENFNGDGAHAYESARLLLVQPLPFWDPRAGDIAAFPGLTSMLFAFPASWFIRLFGEMEVSARLPLLLYLVALHGALVALVEHGRARLLGAIEHWLLWFSLAVYVVAMAYSATYNPYSADIALPATQDTLAMVCLFGFVLGFVRQEGKWAGFFLVLAYLTLPSATLLVGLWLVAVWLTWKPLPRRQMLLASGALLGCMFVSAFAPHLLAMLGLPRPGAEYAFVELCRRLAFLQWADWTRLGFLVVPCGILPALALVAWRWQDEVARAFTLVTLAYFAFFYVQAHIALHYFVPVMLTPLVVFWRMELIAPPRIHAFALAAMTVAASVALVISLPRHAAPHTTARRIGSAIEVRIPGYDSVNAGAFREALLLRHLFPTDWDPRVPLQSYGGATLVWNYYAHQKSPGTGDDINYVLQSVAEPIPAGTHVIADDGQAALVVKSDAVWASHAAIRPPSPPGSAIYAIPRGILFRSVPLVGGPHIVSVVEVLRELGIDVNPVLDRLGVAH